MTRLPLAEYLREPGLWSFMRGTLTTFKSNAALPGVFEANPYRAPLGTIWTLKYEVFATSGSWSPPSAASSADGSRRPDLAGLGIALTAAAALRGAELPKGLETALRLPLIFSAGACLYLWRDACGCRRRPRLPGCGDRGPRRTPAYPALLFLAEAYGAVWLALGPMARDLFDPKADLSYGIYLYGWPIQQSLHALWPDPSGLALLAPALALTLPVAALSWYGIERPALALKARALGRRSLGTIEPAGP